MRLPTRRVRYEVLRRVYRWQGVCYGVDGNTPIWEARSVQLQRGTDGIGDKGAVTACYGPLLLGTREVQSEVTQLLEVQQGNDRHSHPRTLLSLVRPIVNKGKRAEVVFYNGGDTPLTFSWRLQTDEDAAWQTITLGAGEMTQDSS